MHELSIAEALLEIVRPHAGGAPVTAVGVRCGARRAIEPAALELAWQAVTDVADWPGCGIMIEVLPWQMECAACRRHWEGELAEAQCDCGSHEVTVHGSNELTLRWIEIDEVECPPATQATGGAHESASR